MVLKFIVFKNLSFLILESISLTVNYSNIIITFNFTLNKVELKFILSCVQNYKSLIILFDKQTNKNSFTFFQFVILNDVEFFCIHYTY